jgi:hypothetical protein
VGYPAHVLAGALCANIPATFRPMPALIRGAVLSVVAVLLVAAAVPAPAQGQNTPLLEAGPELTQMYLPVNPVGTVQYQPGVGFTMSARLHRALAADLGFSVTPTVPLSGTSFAGGRLTQTLVGVRGGLYIRRIEVCAKVRPGIVSFGDAILHSFSTPSGVQLQTGRLTEPAIDVGGVVIVHASRRLGFRYEAGDTLIDYRPRFISASESHAGHMVNTLAFGLAFVVDF